jgi:hypothetical protein
MFGSIQLKIVFFYVAKVAVLIFFSIPLFAQLPNGASDGYVADETMTERTGSAVTEQQVIELALKNSRKLQSLGTNVAIASYRFQASGKMRNPELRLSDISTRYYTDEFDELRVGLRFRLPRLGEMGEEKQSSSGFVGSQGRRNSLSPGVHRQGATGLCRCADVRPSG